MKKTICISIVVLMIIMQFAFAESEYATESMLLSLSPAWVDMSSLFDDYDSVFMDSNGLLLLLKVDSIQSQFAEMENGIDIQSFVNNLNDEVKMAVLQYSLKSRLGDVGANAAVQSANMSQGLIGCYCSVEVDDKPVVIASALSNSEEWFFMLGDLLSMSTTDQHKDASDLEEIMAEVLSGLSLKEPLSQSTKDNSIDNNISVGKPVASKRSNNSREDVIAEVLRSLDDELYQTTYNTLAAGEIIQKGSKGDAAKGLQLMLLSFGQDIKVDGSVGSKTISALNTVQSAFGLEETDNLDATGFNQLLPRLLITVDPEKGDAVLRETMDYAEYQYMEASSLFIQGRYYSAQKTYEKSNYGDWEQRAADCIQPWPKTGVLYKNPEVKGSSAQFRMTVNSKESDTAMLVKIYTTDNQLARSMFIVGSGTATVSLPAGTYIIKDGIGRNWYGELEAFGREGYYEIMTFENGTTQTTINKNYRQTITMNVETHDPTANSVETDYVSWEDF